MLDKLNILCSFIITINLWIKLNAATNINQNANSVLQNRVANTSWSSVTEDEDTWQPIKQNYKWLAAATTLAPQQPVSTTPSKSAIASLWQSENFTNNSASNLKQKYSGYFKPPTNYNYTHHNGNYSKRYLKPSTLTASSLLSELPSASAPPQSLQNAKLKSYIFSTNNKNNNKNNKYRTRGRGKIQLSSHPKRQQLSPLNNAETLYPQIQIPKDIISQVQEQQQPLSSTHHAKYEKNSISSELNLKHHIADVAEYKQLITPSYWHYLQKPQFDAKNIISLTPKIATSNTNTTRRTNLNVKTNTIGNGKESGELINNAKNFNDTIITKTLNSFAVNENLIDNEIANNEKHQPHNHHHYDYKNLENNDFKANLATNVFVKNSTKSTKSISANAPVVVATDDENEENLNVEFLLLKQTLNNVETFYDNIKDIILSITSSSDDYEDDNDGNDDDDDIYSNEEKTNDDNDLQIQNFAPLQAFKDTSTTVATSIMAAMKKIDSLNMKNILLSTASIGEVQGRNRQNDKGAIKYSLLTSPPPALPPSSTSTPDISKTLDTQARGRVWNLPTKSYAATHSSLSASTAKGLTAIISGRKVKKVKKKFKELLLPLLLAYKLKFMALIPLLIGGLTLLVGSTGLAGFFFALFTAVMSLKSGSRNAVVVKKYIH